MATAPDTSRAAHFTRQQVAERYRACETTINNWLREMPDFPRPFRVGKKLLWRLEDLLAFEAKAIEGPTDAA